MSLTFLIIVLFAIGSANAGFNASDDAQRVRFDGHRVYSVSLPSAKSVHVVKFMKHLGVDFWNEPYQVNQEFKIRVPPQMVYAAEQVMNNFQIPHQVLTENLQDWIDHERQEMESEASEIFGLHDFPLDNFHNLAETNQWVKSIAESHKDKVKLEKIGKTYEGRDITLVKITFPGKTNTTVAKPAIWIDYTIHAREWASHAIGLWTLNRLLTTKDAEKALISSFDWYILPVTNPDGFDYTWTSNRLWRKNRVPGILNCYGTDLNRNFDMAWEKGNPIACFDDYRGKSAFSEKETQGIRDFVSKNKVTAVFTIHANAQMWMFPWAYTTDQIEDFKEMSALNKKAADAVRGKFNIDYKDGQISTTIYKAYGSSSDWFYKQGVKYNFAVEVRDKNKGFELPRKMIIPTAEENWEGIKIVAQHLKQKF